MERLQTILLWASTLGALMIAGVFFAFSNFVMPALARLPQSQGAAAMNSINVTVINPLFMAVFMGTGLVCAVLAAPSLAALPGAAASKITAAAAVYIIGSIGVTMACNVPWNDALAARADDAALWAGYLKTWTMWNNVRACAALAAGGLFMSVLV